jgi:hypothetical protein
MSGRVESAETATDKASALRNWIMLALTLLLVLLYGGALTGWLRPLADEKIVARLEPIIFVVIGYNFGRLPAQHNESIFGGEINRQTQKADAAQHAREYAERDREALEQKMKDARTALVSAGQRMALKEFVENLDRAGTVKEDALRRSVITALNILNS